MQSYRMEVIEMIGWMVLGFVPTYAAVGVGTRKLAKRMSARLFLNLDEDEN